MTHPDGPRQPGDIWCSGYWREHYTVLRIASHGGVTVLWHGNDRAVPTEPRISHHITPIWRHDRLVNRASSIRRCPECNHSCGADGCAENTCPVGLANLGAIRESERLALDPEWLENAPITRANALKFHPDNQETRCSVS